jgi:hypothetical protein
VFFLVQLFQACCVYRKILPNIVWFFKQYRRRKNEDFCNLITPEIMYVELADIKHYLKLQGNPQRTDITTQNFDKKI